jgi:tetratricopeptide (TPR) repeat protein
LGAQPDDEKLLVQAAALHRFAANVSRNLNDNAASESAFAAAIKILQDLTIRFPAKSLYRNELALALSDRCLFERLAGRLRAATATIDQAISLLQATDRMPGETAYQRNLTIGLLELDRAEVAYRRGQFVDFETYSRRANELLDSLKSPEHAAHNPAEPIFQVIAINYWSRAERELGKIAEALAHHEAAVAIVKGLATPKASRDIYYQVCDVRTERARTWALIPERRAAAADDLVEVIKVAEKLVEDNPSFAMYRTLLATASLRRAELLIALGKPDDAIAELSRSMAVSRILLDRFGNLPDSLLVRGESYLALGTARVAAGKKTEAAAAFKSAKNVMKMAITADPDNIHVQRAWAAAQKVAPP